VESIREVGLIADLGGSKLTGGMMSGIGIRGRNSRCRCWRGIQQKNFLCTDTVTCWWAWWCFLRRQWGH